MKMRFLLILLVFSWALPVAAQCTADPTCGDGTGIRGDADGNGCVEMADATFILNFIFTYFIDSDDVCECMGMNPNKDAHIDIQDPAYIINHLQGDGPDPLPPFPNPALDSEPAWQDCFDSSYVMPHVHFFEGTANPDTHNEESGNWDGGNGVVTVGNPIKFRMDTACYAATGVTNNGVWGAIWDQVNFNDAVLDSWKFGSIGLRLEISSNCIWRPRTIDNGDPACDGATHTLLGDNGSYVFGAVAFVTIEDEDGVEGTIQANANEAGPHRRDNTWHVGTGGTTITGADPNPSNIDLTWNMQSRLGWVQQFAAFTGDMFSIKQVRIQYNPRVQIQSNPGGTRHSDWDGIEELSLLFTAENWYWYDVINNPPAP